MARTKRLPGNRKNFGATAPIQLPRSRFDLSRNWKGTFDAGLLIPFFVSEALPGDSRKVRLSSIIRLATPIKPFFDNLVVDFHFWWTPMRQLWENWEKFMGEQDNPGDSTDFLVPQTTIADQTEALHDYMGCPPRAADHVTTNYLVSALPARCYARIYNFHYRDQNLIDSVPQATGDGPDSLTDTSQVLLRRGKRHDYLTASLPFQQKGNPVDLPLGSSAPIYTDQAAGFVSVGQGVNATQWDTFDSSGASLAHTGNASAGVSTLFADLAAATAASITDLRQAIAVQHVLERDARSGTRYPEILLSRFRVMDPQMLVLQRPEYLGGGTVPVTISPISQTTPDPTGTETPQGNLAAVGTAVANGIGFTRNFTEHGLIMGIMSARADLTYQQGIERMWSRRERFDFFTPELAHLSEEAVLQKEIYVTGTVGQAGDDAVWGYVGAYDSYRYAPSLITSKFRSTVPDTLDVWHLSQEFSGPPTLNQTFIEENPPVDRVISVQSEPHFLADIFISDLAARGMPISGIPGLTRI